MVEVNVKDARRQLSGLLNRVEKGKEIIIKRRGKRALIFMGTVCRLTFLGCSGSAPQSCSSNTRTLRRHGSVLPLGTASKPCPPLFQQASVQGPVLDCLCHVGGIDVRALLQVGYGPGYLEYPGVGPGTLTWTLDLLKRSA